MSAVLETALRQEMLTRWPALFDGRIYPLRYPTDTERQYPSARYQHISSPNAAVTNFSDMSGQQETRIQYAILWRYTDYVKARQLQEQIADYFRNFRGLLGYCANCPDCCPVEVFSVRVNTYSLPYQQQTQDEIEAGIDFLIRH